MNSSGHASKAGPDRTSIDVLIVGGGHGGAQAAAALRQNKFGGSVAIICDEPEPPYERPPLSKDYLVGERPFERMLLRPTRFWTDQQIDLLLGRRVIRVDAATHHVTTQDGHEVAYRSLIWSAGGQPRRLTCQGHDLNGVHTIRTRSDTDQLLAELPSVTRVVIVGGGYIGLEAAASLSKLGKRVTVVEALDRVLARVAGPALSQFYEAEHRRHGVDIRVGTAVDCILGADGRVGAVRLADGAEIPCDLVIVGIGITPAVGPLVEAGAEAGNGVAVDGQCRTSLPDIFAIGDCAWQGNPFADGARLRVESVQNATEMATAAARALTGQPETARDVPWFWSNQYDLKLQTIGLSAGHDEAITRGEPGSRSFSVVYLKQGRVIALDCVNAMKDFVQGRKLVLDRVTIPAARLEDAAVPLKDMARAGR